LDRAFFVSLRAGGQHHVSSLSPAHSARRPAARSQHPATRRLLPIVVGVSGRQERPLTTSSCFSASQAHPGPPSYLSSPALRCNAPIPHDRCPLSLTVRARLPLLCAPLSPSPARPTPPTAAPWCPGCRAPCTAPGLPASPSRALRDPYHQRLAVTA
jgi:hypothetical protein